MVPVYNGARFLHESLGSIVAQTWSRREIVVMDDASTDETPAIVASFGRALQYHRQSANRGQFNNVADGIARARGEYKAVFHADDLYDPDVVEREVAFLEARPNVGAVFCLDRFIDGTGWEYGRLVIPRALRGAGALDYARVVNAILEYKNVFMPTPGAMVRTALYREAGGFHTEFGSATDLDMWLRLARIMPIGLLEEHLFRYRHTRSSVGQSYQLLRTGPENFFAVMDHCLAEGGDDLVRPRALRAYEAHRAVDWLRCAVNAYIQQDLALARRLLAKVRLSCLVASRRVPRVRELALFAGLSMLCRIPYVAAAGRALHWRFYGRLPWWGQAA